MSGRSIFAVMSGHDMILEQHDCRFGHGYRPVCIGACGYVGPVVNLARAEEIADEHRLKSVGAWVPAK